MTHLEQKAIETIISMYGTVATIMHVECGGDAVDIFFRDHKGQIKEYYQKIGNKHCITDIK